MRYRWSALEVLSQRQFSQFSDAWSFGVTCWEVFEFGTLPYGSMSDQEIFDFLSQQNRLEKPKDCPESVWKVIVPCWRDKPASRPSFSSLKSQLSQMDFTVAGNSMHKYYK